MTPTPSGTLCYSGSFGQSVTTGMGNIGLTNSAATLAVIPIAGKVSSLSFYATAGEILRVGLYSDGGSGPGTLMAESNSVTAVDGLNTAAIAPQDLAAGNYYLAVKFASSGPGGPIGINNTTGMTHMCSCDLGSAWSDAMQVGWELAIQANFCSPNPLPTATATPTVTATPTITLTGTSTWSPTFSPTPGTHTPTPTFCYPGTFGEAVTTGLVNYGTIQTSASPAQFPYEAVITSIGFYATPGAILRLGVYSDGGSSPGTLIAATSPVTSTGGLNDAPIGPLDLQAGKYYLASEFSTDSPDSQIGANQSAGTILACPCDLGAPWTQNAANASYHLSLSANFCSLNPLPTAADTPTVTLTPTPPPSTCGGFGAQGPVTDPGSVGGLSTRFGLYHLDAYADVSQVDFFITTAQSNATGLVRVFVYSNNSVNGTPLSLLGNSTAQVMTFQQGWNGVALPDLQLSPGDYWLGASVNVTGPGYDWWCSADTGGGGNSQDYADNFPPAGLSYYVSTGYPDFTFRAICSQPVTVPTSTPTSTPTQTYTPTATTTPCDGLGTSLTGNDCGGLTGEGTRFGQYTLNTSSTVAGISVYITSTSSPILGMAKAFIYTPNGSNGLPDTLVAESSAIVVTWQQGWNIIPLPDTPLSPGVYWLGACLNLGGTYDWWSNGTTGGGAYAGLDLINNPAPANVNSSCSAWTGDYVLQAYCH